MCAHPLVAFAKGLALVGFWLLLAATTAGAILTTRCGAQTSPTRYPSWNGRAIREDGPLRAPRVVFAYLDASSGLATYALLRTTLPVGATKAAWTSAIIAGFVPHVVGAVTGQYGVDVPDWTADFIIRGGSSLLAPFCRSGLRRKRCLVATTSYALAATFAFGYTR